MTIYVLVVNGKQHIIALQIAQQIIQCMEIIGVIQCLPLVVQMAALREIIATKTADGWEITMQLVEVIVLQDVIPEIIKVIQLVIIVLLEH